jgi:calcium-dependent protein kinase
MCVKIASIWIWSLNFALTGGELFDQIIAKTQSSKGHFLELNATQLVRDILDVIAYCHDVKGIDHHDLKPENFHFLTEDEDAPVKIIDFGLSRHSNQNQGIMKTKVGKLVCMACNSWG